jgi:hypothetical protein
MLTFSELSSASRATTLTYRVGSLLSTEVPENSLSQLGFPPAQATLPDKLPCSCKAHRFVLPGGSRRSRLAAWPFRSPAGKKNIIGGRGHRQIKRRGSRTLAQGPSRAFAQRPRSQATRTTPHGPQIRSWFTAGQPERADRCCRLIWGCTRVTARGNMTFLRMEPQVRAIWGGLVPVWPSAAR